MPTSWLQPPRLRTEGEHRQATWLELFFDLVFVVTVAGLAALLRQDLTAAGIGWLAFLFLPIWWLWMDYSYYGDLFDTDDVVYRLALLAVMFGIVAVSRVAPEVIWGGAAWGGGRVRWDVRRPMWALRPGAEAQPRASAAGAALPRRLRPGGRALRR